MKSIKRVVLCLLVILISCNFSIVLGSDITYSDNNKGSYKKDEVLLSGNYNYTEYEKIKATTTNNNVTSKQLVYTYIQKQTKDSKVVTWAVSGDSGKLSNNTVSAIAVDYEKNHDDWIVVGGINADQYTTGFGTNVASNGKDFYSPQTYYPFIADGEGWFSITAIPYFGHNIAGFLQDGSSDPIVSGSASLNNGEIKLAGLFIYILDENGNRIARFEANHINESPRALETTIWTPIYGENQKMKEIVINEFAYIVDDAKRAYPNNSIDYASYKDKNAYDAFFGKGVITRACEKAEIGYGCFGIQTNDENLKNALEIGKEVIVQYEYQGALGKVESATGYHSIQRMNGMDVEGVGDYNVLPYPRSVVGRTENGEIVLLAVDGKAASQGRTGTTHNETNAILKSLGVVEAYQMDGGGSVTAIIRDENGSFKVINNPADGSPRRVLTALLLVERKKPEIKNIEIISEGTSLNINYQYLHHGNNVKEVYLKFDDKVYNLNKDEINRSIKIDNLEVNSTHNYSFVCILEEEVEIKNGIAKVEYVRPTVIKCEEVEDLLIDIQFNNPSKLDIEYYIIIDDEQFYPDSNGKVKINLYKKGNTYLIFKVKEMNVESKIKIDLYNFYNILDKEYDDIYSILEDIYK